MGLFRYTDKVGKGVSKGETNKKRFFYFFELYFRKIGKLILLNWLSLALCPPVVTIGPATAGLTYILRNFAEEKSVFLTHDFLKAMKSNFKQAFLFSLLDLLVMGVGGFAFFYYFTNTTASSLGLVIPAIICCLLVMIWIFIRSYTYMMIVTIELPLKPIMKNALMFFFLGIKTNLITFAILSLIAVLSLWFFPYSMVFYLIIGVSTVYYIPIFNGYQYIVKYIIDPQRPQTPQEETLPELPVQNSDLKENEILPGVPVPVDPKTIFTDLGEEEPAAETTVEKKKKNRVIR